MEQLREKSLGDNEYNKIHIRIRKVAGHRRILGSCQGLWIRNNWNLNRISEKQWQSFVYTVMGWQLTITTEKWDLWVITGSSMKMSGQCSSSQENKCNSRNYYERNGKQNRKLHFALFVETHGICTVPASIRSKWRGYIRMYKVMYVMKKMHRRWILQELKNIPKEKKVLYKQFLHSVYILGTEYCWCWKLTWV